jgi:hypothetical protein
VVDDAEAVAQSLGFVQIVRGVHHGCAGRGNRADQVEDAGASLRIQAHGRLVHQHDFRIVHQSRGDVEPPQHAAREVLDGLLRTVGETHPLQHAIDARVQVGSRQPVQLAKEPQIVARRELRVERDLLGHDPEHAPGVDGPIRDVDPVEPRLSGIRLHQAAQNADRRRLAGAVGPEQAIDFSRGDPERDPFERLVVAEFLAQIGDFNHDEHLLSEKATRTNPDSRLPNAAISQNRRHQADACSSVRRQYSYSRKTLGFISDTMACTPSSGPGRITRKAHCHPIQSATADVSLIENMVSRNPRHV